MKYLLFIAAFLLISACVNAQSMFKPFPKPVSQTASPNGYTRSLSIVDSLTPGINYTGFRFTGPTVLYAVSPSSLANSALFTGVGIDYEKCTWDTSAKKFYTNYAIGVQFLEGGSFAPASISAVSAVALTVSLQTIGSLNLPFKLTVGVMYNISTKTTMLGVGPGIPLNN